MASQNTADRPYLKPTIRRTVELKAPLGNAARFKDEFSDWGRCCAVGEIIHNDLPSEQSSIATNASCRQKGRSCCGKKGKDG